MISDWALWEIKFGDWLNVVGLLLSATAAAKAWTAAREARNLSKKIQLLRTTLDLSQLTKSIEYLRTLHRSAASKDSLLSAYSEIARNISSHRGSLVLNHTERNLLSDTLSDIREMEAAIDKVGTKSKELDTISFNERLAARLDEILGILSQLEERNLSARR